MFKARKDILFEVPQRLLHTFKEIFMEECYMHGLPHKIRAFPVFIDIGANAGYFSLYAASRFANAKIIAYEPIPSNFEQLRRNLNLNKNSKIVAFQKAVAGYSGEAVMAFDGTDNFSTFAHIVDESNLNDKNNSIKVQCVTIKNIFDDNKLDSCDFLKMDCEGAENEIIFNCPVEYLSRIKQFAIEVHGDAKSLKKYLHDNGFITHETKRALGMLYAWKV
ncbi:MAG: FkbM family methyltransferase [Thermodesulfobacteriota bacterium]|nr:FkbM family methyltransferase [Thermodesulfobacteriota bacterium]